MPPRRFRICRDLYRIFRAERPNVVHNMTVKPNVYGSLAARLAGVPRIVSLVCGRATAFPRAKAGTALPCVSRCGVCTSSAGG